MQGASIKHAFRQQGRLINRAHHAISTPTFIHSIVILWYFELMKIDSESIEKVDNFDVMY